MTAMDKPRPRRRLRYTHQVRQFECFQFAAGSEWRSFLDMANIPLLDISSFRRRSPSKPAALAFVLFHQRNIASITNGETAFLTDLLIIRIVILLPPIDDLNRNPLIGRGLVKEDRIVMSYYAHVNKRYGQEGSSRQSLREHLIAAACGARERASAAIRAGASLSGWEEAAYIAGLLHDLGKYRAPFQKKLLGVQVQDPRETFHKGAGAAKAFELKRPAVAFAVAGHHGGLPDHEGLRTLILGIRGEVRSSKEVVEKIWPIAIADCPELANLGLETLGETDSGSADLLTRLVFSCLVDADWADAADFERKANGWPDESPPPRLDPETLFQNVLNHLAERADQCVEPIVKQARDDVLQACLRAADQPPGLFSLTVPTGGGKTLAGLAFALKHAAAHAKRRIIYVAPYLSIIDQNASAMRRALGIDRNDPTLFEHHSLAEPSANGLGGGNDSEETRLASSLRRAENWDAPVIVTTNVQFFESLFSNRPGACRKLHNVAGSVILLDECQTIPPGLVAPTCAMLNRLVERLGCSLVLCTATQPAFGDVGLLANAALQNVREIAPAEADLFQRLKRVRMIWPKRDDHLDWNAVAERLAREDSALCVVNSKRAAEELFQTLKTKADGRPVFHLSTNMCPAHRMSVLRRVKTLLLHRKSCLLVSTQLVEAGVDLDFPLVMRELAPLESIIQAAGRCNREGKRNLPDGSPGGTVVVFRSQAAQAEPKRYAPPDLWYSAGTQIVQQNFLNREKEPAIDEPRHLDDYFRRLYRSGSLDLHDIARELSKRDFKHNFSATAQKYRLIRDDTVPVVAVWQKRESSIRKLLEEYNRRPRRSLARELSRYQVNLYPTATRQTSWVVEEPSGILVWRGDYDPDTGIKDLECNY